MACEFCADDEDRYSDHLNQSDVMRLVAAIAIGSIDEALLCLDVVFRDDPKAREWIAQARARAMRRAA